VRNFERVADFLIPHRRAVHVVVLFISLLMVPGMILALSPIDMESYNMESPELDARSVILDEYPSNEVVAGYAVIIRDQSLVGSPPQWVYADEIGEYGGDASGVAEPVGGILNLTVLREISLKAEAARNDPLAEFYRPIISDVTLVQHHGVMTLSDLLRVFMANESLQTRPSLSPMGVPLPPRTNWSDCGALECLKFDDENLTQAHIDLASQRLANASEGTFLRWLSLDRAFQPADDGGAIGPVGGTLSEGGMWANASWERGRWSASSTWILVQFDRGAAEAAGWTFEWAEARAESGYDWQGLRLVTTPPNRDSEFCAASVESGEGPCSWEWSLISLEHAMRENDDLTVTMAVAEGINVEVNRELQESITLLVAMVLIVLVLLWGSLRRWSDVVIVSAGLGLSLLWMHGLIGWVGQFSAGLGYPVIERSQFSNLLPILILALGIDDSLHALHRYKEERKKGDSPNGAARISLSRVGRAIMLTSLTTIAAFSANLVSDIPALRSFGTEAALGVASAFILTGLWVPLVRLDWDLWLGKREKLLEEDVDKIHLIPSHWLANTASGSAVFGPIVIIVSLLITAFATPMMLSLEGDFKAEDFFDEKSDFAAVVSLINERFYSEGEPGEILIEGDVIDPQVFQAIAETRANMGHHGPDDPDKFTVTADGTVEVHGYDELVYLGILSMANNVTPFEQAGWDQSVPKGGMDCDTTPFGLPHPDDEDCLRFMVGFISVHGVPATNSTPGLPPSVMGLYITPDRELDPANPSQGIDGSEPQYERMLIRFGLRQPEQFPMVEKALAELERDMSPFQNLSKGDMRVRADIDVALSDDEYPVSWAMATGEPVARYVAASSLQNEMQSTLKLGVVFCVLTLWWGFRPSREELENRRAGGAGGGLESDGLVWTFASRIYAPVAVGFATGLVLASQYGSTVGLLLGLFTTIAGVLWGFRPLGTALLTTTPIIIVVVWLYGLIAAMGYGLNMVTVAIATLSLGVGIDYVIHVVERFREERYKGIPTLASIAAVGGASGLALFGSAASDVLGFLIISQSRMGFFSLFGTFSAAMIFFSLIASLVIACGLIGVLNYRKVLAQRREQKMARSLAGAGADGEQTMVST
jgi:hypothetical protein